MKIFKSIFVLALMALTLNANAGTNSDGDPQLKSKVVDEHTVVVQLFNLQQEVTKISIQSLDGETTYFQEYIRKHNGYLRKINLENLQDGRYLIQVDHSGKTKTQVILVKDKAMQLSSIVG